LIGFCALAGAQTEQTAKAFVFSRTMKTRSALRTSFRCEQLRKL
jgi:hypothetical protein